MNKGGGVILLWTLRIVLWRGDSWAICFMEVAQHDQKDSILSVISYESRPVTRQSFSWRIVYVCKLPTIRVTINIASCPAYPFQFDRGPWITNSISLACYV